MAEDIFISESLRTEWDEIGDLRTVEDEENDAAQIRQSLAISVMEDVGFGAPSFDDTSLEAFRAEVERAIRNNPQSEPPIDAIITDVNHTEQVLELEASTRRVSLPITFE